SADSEAFHVRRRAAPWHVGCTSVAENRASDGLHVGDVGRHRGRYRGGTRKRARQAPATCKKEKMEHAEGPINRSGGRGAPGHATLARAHVRVRENGQR